MKWIKSLIFIGVAVAFTACGGGGGGSSSTPPPTLVDNAAVAEGQNEYGYYGNEVIFGNSVAVGNWTNKAVYNGSEETVIIDLYSGGEMSLTNITRGISFDGTYGISHDGANMKTSLGDTVAIQSSIGNNCYNVLLTNINKIGSLSAKLCKN